MKDKLVEVESIEGVKIHFSPISGRFFVGEEQYERIEDAKRAILKDKETAFSGTFFINDSWDGIVEFVAKRKIYDSYDGEYKIVGDKQKSAGHSRIEVLEKDLYPFSKYNKDLLKEAQKMDSEGWKLIWEAKRFGAKLKKEV